MSGPGEWAEDAPKQTPSYRIIPPSEPALELFISEPAGELFGALAKAQGELTNPLKGKTAKTGTYSYDYANIADVLDEARPVLSKHGIAVSQWPLRGMSRELALVTILAHSSGQYMQGTLRWDVGDSKMQTLGGAITYLRRYALQSVIGVAAEADLDGDAPGAAPEKTYEKRNGGSQRPAPPPPAAPSAAQVKAEIASLKTAIGPAAVNDILFELGFSNEAAIKTLSDGRRFLAALQTAAGSKHRPAIDDSDVPSGLFPPSEQRSGANYPD